MRLGQGPQIGQDRPVAGSRVLPMAAIVRQLDVVEDQVGQVRDLEQLLS